jgi:hypothetical protein
LKNQHYTSLMMSCSTQITVVMVRFLDPSNEHLAIAKSMPPEFVTKVGCRYNHSLSPAAFECIHDKYKQLLLLQALARVDAHALAELDAQAILKEFDLCAYSEHMTGKSGMYIPNNTSFAVSIICALVMVITLGGGDTSSVAATGLNLMRNKVSTTKDGEISYGRIRANYTRVRGLASMNCPLPINVPDQNNLEHLILCLKHILKEQAGLCWKRKPNDETKFELKAHKCRLPLHQ